MKKLLSLLSVFAVSSAFGAGEPVQRNPYSTNFPNATIYTGGPLLITPGYGGQFGLGTNVAMGVDGFGNSWRWFVGTDGWKWFHENGSDQLYTIADGTDNWFESKDKANFTVDSLNVGRNVGASSSSKDLMPGSSGSAQYETDIPVYAIQPNKTNVARGILSGNTEAGNTNITALRITNVVTQITTNGMTSAWIARGVIPAYFLDEGAQLGPRVGGLFSINPNNFPSGTLSNVTAHLHANSMELYWHIYYASVIPAGRNGQSGDTQLLGAFAGQRTWFYPSRTLYTGGSTSVWSQAIMTPDSTFNDIATLYTWNVDGIISADCLPYNGVIGFEAQRARNIAWSALYISTGFKPAVATGQKTLKLGFFANDLHEAFAGMANMHNVNEIGVDFPLYTSGGLAWGMGYLRAYHPVHSRLPPNGPYPIFTSNGDNGTWTTNDYKGITSVASLAASDLYYADVNTTAINSNCVAASTNDLELALSNSRYREWPVPVYDGGSNSVWVRHISALDKAVLFVNQGNANTNLTIDWDDHLKVPLGSLLVFTNVWDRTNTVSFGDTMTLTVPPTNFIYFHVRVLGTPQNVIARAKQAGTSSALIVEASNGTDIWAMDDNPAAPGNSALWGNVGTRGAGNYFLQTDGVSYGRVNTPVAGTSLQFYDANTTLMATLRTNALMLGDGVFWGSATSTAASSVAAPIYFIQWTNTAGIRGKIPVYPQ